MASSANSHHNGEYLLLRHLSGEINTFIDVGANKGDWSAEALRLGASRGFCFEPSAQCVQYLSRRFEGSNISIRPKAVSDKVGVSFFYEEEDFGETSSLCQQAERGNVNRTEIQLTTLDLEFTDQDSVIVDYLKIDSEGWDLKVMKGASDLLMRVKFVQFEYNSYWLDAGSTLKDALGFLENLGYRVYLIKPTGLHPFDYNFWGDYFRYSNFFACRKSDEHLLGEMVCGDL